MIVYYDFAFAFQDIENFLQEYYSYDFDLNMIRINFDDISNYKKYKERKKKYRFYIDAEWIHNIAKLASVLQPEDLKTVYEWYGDLSTVQKVFNALPQDISYGEDKAVYSIMLRKWCREEMSLDGSRTITAALNKEVCDLVHRLSDIGRISDVFNEKRNSDFRQ